METTRRQFLKSLPPIAGILGFPTLLRASELNSRVQHACIGLGGLMGNTDLKSFLGHSRTDVVAICDVDAGILERAAKVVPNARTYRDWREMLAKEGNRIDSINACVPDHMHAAISYTAMSLGKHVYCQKPMCHDVAEIRALTKLAAKTGLKSQLGNQYASSLGDRMTVEYIKSGVIGKIKHVYLCSNRESGMAYRLDQPQPPEAAIPATLAWDLWLGTAPHRPYSADVYHPSIWRTWLDFGTGWLGDIGCHILSAPWKALNLSAPDTIHARVNQSWLESSEKRARLWPQANHITWTFPGNEMTAGSNLSIEWFDGVDPDFYIPEEFRSLYPGEKFPEEAALFIGEQGALLLPHTSGPQLLPKDKFTAVPRPNVKGENHYHSFVNSILDGTPCESSFDLAGPMSEAVILGTVAARYPGQKLEWDSKSMRFAQDEANASLRRTYRDGWKIEGLG
ncbi:MAG: Gfo/Idh/MocA family oxidoreductase [Gloeobacteraceae cyanobacterium ES-bin-144]|nr:Gfo/Idh/MocA family oxidoreductase [Verrucomicrobiales bacterium]